MLAGCSPGQPSEQTFSPTPEILSSPDAPAVLPADCPQPKTWEIEFQREGGIMGSSMQLKVASDGTLQAQDLNTQDTFTQTLNPSQVLEIENLLVQACPFETGRAAQACPDCYEYSMSIQMDEELFRVKVSDTSIPQDLQPLIQTLSILLQQSLTP
jgi:hypothetical protein